MLVDINLFFLSFLNLFAFFQENCLTQMIATEYSFGRV